jgi:hypothetical protein
LKRTKTHDATGTSRCCIAAAAAAVEAIMPHIASRQTSIKMDEVNKFSRFTRNHKCTGQQPVFFGEIVHILRIYDKCCEVELYIMAFVALTARYLLIRVILWE